jgi:dihydropteroate synthase
MSKTSDSHSVRLLKVRNSNDAAQILGALGVDPAGVPHMSGKALSHVVCVSALKPPQALILKQEMLSLGGDAAVHRDVITGRIARSAALLLGSEKQLKALGRKLREQPLGLRLIGEKVLALLQPEASPRQPVFRRQQGGTAIMGILNLTPDSFADGGSYRSTEAALTRVREMVAAGADIIDIGAESTRPGYIPVSAQAEWERLEPVFLALSADEPGAAPLSVDTQKAEVADRALAAGAQIVNDIWGLQQDAEMAGVTAARGAGVVVTHNRTEPTDDDIILDILRYWDVSLNIALAAGIREEKIIVDPGIGFGKTPAQNLTVLRRLGELKAIGFPLLLAASRKSVIAHVLDIPIEDRLAATLAIHLHGVAHGADIVRVHDVLAHRHALDMAAALSVGEPPAFLR